RGSRSTSGGAAHAAAEPRHRRSGRLGARLSRHPVAERVLRGQARHPGLHRGGPLRAPASPERRVDQPVPPIYEPEVAARAIHFAATHRRRELWVGGSTAVVSAGNKLLPGVGDWYLGRTGYASQQRDGAPPADRRHNLWNPVDDERDFGARGSFGARAHRRSVESWLSRHRTALAALAVAAALAI